MDQHRENIEKSAEPGACADNGAGRACEQAGEAAERADEARGLAALYDYCAGLFLQAIAVPGSDEARDIARRTALLVAPAAEVPGVAELALWAQGVAALDDDGLAAEQRRLAADCTFLFRGLSAEAPLPPYEAYHLAPSDEAAQGRSPLPALARAYAQADVHVSEDLGERDDYLGCELAFAAHLAVREAAALDEGNLAEAASLRDQRETFERDHLGSWAARWCDGAAGAARTPFFRAFLTFTGAMLA